jgi:hypothetical protein
MSFFYETSFRAKEHVVVSLPSKIAARDVLPFLLPVSVPLSTYTGPSPILHDAPSAPHNPASHPHSPSPFASDFPSHVLHNVTLVPHNSASHVAPPSPFASDLPSPSNPSNTTPSPSSLASFPDISSATITSPSLDPLQPPPLPLTHSSPSPSPDPPSPHPMTTR